MLILGMENHFLSKIATVGSKNLRNFLKIYFYTYLQEECQSNPVMAKGAREYAKERPARIPPGLRCIEKYLGCSRTTAQYYLRAVQVTREFFVNYEIEKDRKVKPLVRVTRKDYKELRWNLAAIFSKAAKSLRVPEIGLQASEIRKSLRVAAELIKYTNGVFTAEDCAQIIDEFANCLV